MITNLAMLKTLGTVQKRPRSDQDLLGGVRMPTMDGWESERHTQKMRLRSPLPEIRIISFTIPWQVTEDLAFGSRKSTLQNARKQPDGSSFQQYESV